MSRKGKNNKNIFVLFIILFVVYLFGFVFKDKINFLLNTMYFVNDEKLIIKDNVISNYINYLENEIIEYKEINKLTDCVNASVIYRNPTYWYDEITINKGKNSNIKVGDMVINNEGVVGSVSMVLDNSSTVSLLTSLSSERKITLALDNSENKVYGILSNYNKIKNEMEISEITSEIVYSNNINVTTTSLTNTFKSGIIVGKVIDILDDNNGLSKKAIVKPTVDYNDLKYVCVVVK